MVTWFYRPHELTGMNGMVVEIGRVPIKLLLTKLFGPAIGVLFTLGVLLVLVGVVAEDGGGLAMGIPMLIVAGIAVVFRRFGRFSRWSV